MQTLNQNGITVEASDLVGSNKKSPIHVLHVDDDSSILEISKLMLIDLESSFEIDNACCVAEAFKKLSTNQYDVVVSDYEMPQKNGLEFLKELREQKNDVAFIIFTGRGREDVAVKALNLGADRYLNKNGSPESVYGELAHAIKNLAERKQSKQLLRISESKYRLLVEKSLQGIMIAQNNPLRIAFANVTMGKMLGYKPEEFMTFSPAEVAALVHHEDRVIFFSRFKNRLEGKEAENCYEFRAVRKDGSIVWMEAFASEIEYNGQPAVQAMFLDIDERKKTDELIKKSEARFRELANFLPEIVFETDLTGKITFFSQTAFEITGYTPEEVEKGLSMVQFVVPEDRERAKENIRRRMAGEKTDSSEYTLFRKNGDTYPAIVKTAPIFSENKLVGLRGLVIDISERKHAETSLKEAKAQLELQIEKMPVGCIVWDKDFKVVSWNPAAEKIFGYSATDIIGKHCYNIILSKDVQPVTKKIWRRLLEGDESVQNINDNFTKNGEKITCSWTNAPLKGEENSVIGVLSMVQDITASRKAEELFEKERREFREILDSAPVMIAYKSKDDHFVQVNSAFADFAGLPKEKIVGMTTFDLVKEQDVAKQGRDHDLQVMQTGVPVLNQIVKWSGFNSQKQIWALYSKLPFYDSDGNVAGTISYVLDIDDRKKAEEELQEKSREIQLINEKLRVMGSLMRHDVGNKLMIAKSNLFLLKKQIGNFPELTKYVDNVENALVSSDKIFDFSRLYEKIGLEKPSIENVYSCFNQAVSLIPNLGNIKIVNECEGLFVLADSLLKQLFYNFIDNSIKHGERVTEIRLHYIKDGAGIKLLYEDDGVGVPNDNKSKLFEIGFTTGNGGGLGLYLVNKMMDVYGWSIVEEGESGKGAKFAMLLPRMNKSGSENFSIVP